MGPGEGHQLQLSIQSASEFRAWACFGGVCKKCESEEKSGYARGPTTESRGFDRIPIGRDLELRVSTSTKKETY